MNAFNPMQPIFRYSGKLIGFRVKDKLFNPDGRQVGRLVDDVTFGARGQYIGTISGYRIVYNPRLSKRIQSGFVPTRIITLAHIPNLSPLAVPFGMKDYVSVQDNSAV